MSTVKYFQLSENAFTQFSDMWTGLVTFPSECQGNCQLLHQRSLYQLQCIAYIWNEKEINGPFFGSSRIEDIFYEAMLWHNMNCELSPPLTTHLITQLHEILIFCLCSYYTVVYGAVTCYIYCQWWFNFACLVRYWNCIHTRVQTTCAEVKRDNITCHMRFYKLQL